MTDWNERYSVEEDKELRKPASSLVELFSQKGRGRALDIACGDGRNAIFLASQGYEVTAVDSSEVAITRARKLAKESSVNVGFICADLETCEIEESSYDLIICYYYLQRSIISAMKKGLKKNGVIIFETYTIGQRDIGRPRNKDFLLNPNELLGLFNEMHVKYYREGIFLEEGMKKAIATIVCGKA